MKRSFALLVTLVLLASFSVGCLGDEETPYNQGAPGDFKYEFLQDDPYPNLIIELDYVTGRDMSSSARNLLNQRIKDVTDKDDIQWKKNSFNSEDDSYTVKELLKLEEQHRTEYKGGNNAVLHIFYLNGEFENANAAGVTYTGSSIVLFKDQFESVGTISAEDIEEALDGFGPGGVVNEGRWLFVGGRGRRLCRRLRRQHRPMNRPTTPHTPT